MGVTLILRRVAPRGLTSGSHNAERLDMVREKIQGEEGSKWWYSCQRLEIVVTMAEGLTPSDCSAAWRHSALLLRSGEVAHRKSLPLSCLRIKTSAVLFLPCLGQLHSSFLNQER